MYHILHICMKISLAVAQAYTTFNFYYHLPHMQSTYQYDTTHKKRVNTLHLFGDHGYAHSTTTSLVWQILVQVIKNLFGRMEGRSMVHTYHPLMLAVGPPPPTVSRTTSVWRHRATANDMQTTITKLPVQTTQWPVHSAQCCRESV